MIRILAAILLILPFLIGESHDQTVLLAARRAGGVDVLDPNTLESLGSIKVLPQANSLTSDSTGILFLNEGLAPEFQGCCALYAVDLKTRGMTKLLEPVSGVVVSPNGQHVLAQRGNVGIEAFNVHTLQREASIPSSVAPGVYSLRFSPDGSLLFGVSNFTHTLDIFDFDQRKLVKSFSVSQDLNVLGAWLGNSYYLYGYSGRSGQLWRVKSDDSALEAPVNVEVHDLASDCNSQNRGMIGAGGQLFLFELFGAKGDRRDCARGVHGGLLSIDTQTGKVLARLAPEVHFGSLIPTVDGKELYGIDVRDATWSTVDLVRLNAITGEVLARRNLKADVWSLNLTSVPKDLVPTGPVEATNFDLPINAVTRH
jgi:WD40 repeat protein